MTPLEVANYTLYEIMYNTNMMVARTYEVWVPLVPIDVGSRAKCCNTQIFGLIATTCLTGNQEVTLT